MLKKFFVAVVLVGVAGSANAVTVDANIGDDIFEIGASQTLAARRIGTIRAGGSFLFTNDDDYIYSLRGHVLGNPSSGQFEPLSYGVGPKLYVASLDDGDDGVFGIGLGGFVRLQLPDTVPLPLAAEISGHIAPDILTGAGRGINELIGRIEYRVVPTAAVYLGYRFFEVERNGETNREIDDDFHIGLRLTF